LRAAPLFADDDVRTMSTIPAVLAPADDDDEDVRWALSTASSFWARGETADALKWVRRAAESADGVGHDARSLALFKAAAELTSVIARSPALSDEPTGPAATSESTRARSRTRGTKRGGSRATQPELAKADEETTLQRPAPTVPAAAVVDLSPSARYDDLEESTNVVDVRDVELTSPPQLEVPPLPTADRGSSPPALQPPPTTRANPQPAARPAAAHGPPPLAARPTLPGHTGAGAAPPPSVRPPSLVPPSSPSRTTLEPPTRRTTPALGSGASSATASTGARSSAPPMPDRGGGASRPSTPPVSATRARFPIEVDGDDLETKMRELPSDLMAAALAAITGSATPNAASSPPPVMATAAASSSGPPPAMAATPTLGQPVAVAQRPASLQAHRVVLELGADGRLALTLDLGNENAAKNRARAMLVPTDEASSELLARLIADSRIA
jgi:hypothetical protein